MQRSSVKQIEVYQNKIRKFFMVLRGLSVSYCCKIAYLSNDMLLLKRETNSGKAKKCRGEANLRERERERERKKIKF